MQVTEVGDQTRQTFYHLSNKTDRGTKKRVIESRDKKQFISAGQRFRIHSVNMKVITFI